MDIDITLYRDAELTRKSCRKIIRRINRDTYVITTIVAVWAATVGVITATINSASTTIIGVLSLVMMCKTHYEAMERARRGKKICRYIIKNAHKGMYELEKELLEMEI